MRRITVEENKEMCRLKKLKKEMRCLERAEERAAKNGRDSIGIRSSVIDGLTSFMK